MDTLAKIIRFFWTDYKRYGIWVLRKGKDGFGIIYLEKFSKPPSEKEIDKLKQKFPEDLVVVCPENLVDCLKENILK